MQHPRLSPTYSWAGLMQGPAETSSCRSQTWRLHRGKGDDGVGQERGDSFNQTAGCGFFPHEQIIDRLRFTFNGN
jgi:hypothetical protein